jgi:RHS repeat-associated protein
MKVAGESVGYRRLAPPPIRSFRKACRPEHHPHRVHCQGAQKNSPTCFEGPFGEVIRATGPMAKANPFRFSTKYQEDETDLLHFGYRYYGASTGRWLGRDPSEERGGGNLFCFVSNDAINHNDPLGLMKYSQFYAQFLRMEADLRKQRCCCMDSRRPSVDIFLQGTPSGDRVTMTVTHAASACVEELRYFWWDCFKAQREAPSGGTDSAWKQYGYREGSETDARSETGSVVQDRADSHHWNWQVFVIYTYCGRDERRHAGVRSSNAVIWTYSRSGWSNPQDGGGGTTY